MALKIFSQSITPSQTWRLAVFRAFRLPILCSLTLLLVSVLCARVKAEDNAPNASGQIALYSALIAGVISITLKIIDSAVERFKTSRTTNKEAEANTRLSLVEVEKLGVQERADMRAMLLQLREREHEQNRELIDHYIRVTEASRSSARVWRLEALRLRQIALELILLCGKHGVELPHLQLDAPQAEEIDELFLPSVKPLPKLFDKKDVEMDTERVSKAG